MKRLISIKTVTALMMALTPLLLWADNSITYTATYDYSKLTLGTDTLGGVTYTTVSYEGLNNDGEPGAPSLPIDYIRFSVPYNATNFTVSTVIGNTVTSKLNHMIYPCQSPRMMNDTTPVVITLPDSAAYATDPLHPSPRAWVVDEGFLAGENHIVTVAVQPIANYHSNSGLIHDAVKKSSNVQMTLRYTLTNSPSVYPIIREKDSLRNEGYKLTKSMVVNGADVETNAPLVTRSTIPQNIIEDSIFDDFNPIIYDHPYLIITTEKLKNSVRRIAALKRQKGYRVGIVTVEHIMHSHLGNDGDIITEGDTSYVANSDSAGAIRQYLKYAYKYFGTKFVLFAGTAVPYRIHHDGDSDTDIPTDLYFCDLNANWANRTEREPELYVGRILAKTSNQISNYSDKLFRYELNPGKGDYGYLKRIFYSEAIDFEFFNEWNYVYESYKKIFPNYTRYQEIVNSQFPSGTDVVNEFNSTNYGYISMMNHGSPSGFITYGRRIYYDKDSTIIKPYYYLWSVDSVHIVYYNRIDTLDTHTGNGLNNLTNKWYPSICYSSGCEPAPFDVVNGYNVETNYGESFTTGKDYGGPAFLGNTRDGYFGKQSTKVEKYFAEQLSIGNYKIGIAEAFSRTMYEGDSYFTLIHNLIGEPEFDIWTDIPQQFSNIGITRTNNSISISGIDTVSTNVAYYANDGHIGICTISTDSLTLNGISPNSTIMLYKHNYIPYIAPLLLQNENLKKSQYVIASDVTAGNSIDSKRINGDVIVKNGVQYEIEASGTVRLENGFKVEKGATFAVYPSCF